MRAKPAGVLSWVLRRPRDRLYPLDPTELQPNSNVFRGVLVFGEDQHLLVLVLLPHETGKRRDLRIGARIDLAEPFKQVRNGHDVSLERREQILLPHKSWVQELDPTLLAAYLLVGLLGKLLQLFVRCMNHSTRRVNAEVLAEASLRGAGVITIRLFVCL